MPSVGQLRDRVRVEAPTETPDSGGQPVQSWDPARNVCEVWAQVTSGVPREVWQGRTVQQDGVVTVAIRHRDDVALLNGKGRVVVLTQGNRVLNVEGVQWDDRREWLYLACRTEGRTA